MKRIRYNKWLNRRLWYMQKKLNDLSSKLTMMELIQKLERETRHEAMMNRLRSKTYKTYKGSTPTGPVFSGPLPPDPDKT